MADDRAKELIAIGDRQFAKREPLMSFWQEIGEHFFATRAHFTREPQIGESYGVDQFDSYPEILRRMLGDSVSSMLRPRDRPWFKTITGFESIDKDTGNLRVLEEVTARMRRRMYAGSSNFIGATKQGDHDFTTFGQCVLSVEENQERTLLFMRNFHLSKVCWLENSSLTIDHAHLKDRMSARQMKAKFGEKALHSTVKTACEKAPDTEFDYRIIILPREEYDYTKKAKRHSEHRDPQGRAKNMPFVAVYVDVVNNHVMSESPRLLFPLVIPRWLRLEGSAYAFSPATTIALPDSRLIQSLGRILLEAGEKAIDPPIAAEEGAVREANIASGAMTWIASEDRRIQDVLMPININYDLKAGLALRQDIREMLTRAFYIDKLTLPPVDGAKMTAFEVGRRLEEFVRQSLPLFEPMEVEYNSKLLDAIYAQLAVLGEFSDLPMTPALKNAEIKWVFESPIQTASNRMMVEKFGEVLKLHATGQQLGANSRLLMDVSLHDAMRGTDAPASWMMTDDEAAEAAEAAKAKEMMAMAVQQLQQGAAVAGQVGEAGQALREGGVLPPEGEAPKALPPPSDPRLEGLQALYGA